MNAIVIYKSKYGSTKEYAQWIAQEIGAEIVDVKNIKADELTKYDTIVFGGGLYAEMIGGINFITKNFDKISDKKIAIFTTGLTPPDCREYYDDYVLKKNFKPYMLDKIKVFNFPGKMITEEPKLFSDGLDEDCPTCAKIPNLMQFTPDNRREMEEEEEW